MVKGTRERKINITNLGIGTHSKYILILTVYNVYTSWVYNHSKYILIYTYCV